MTAMTTILAAANYLEGKAHLIEDYEGGGDIGIGQLIFGIIMVAIFLGPPIAAISALREKEWKAAIGWLFFTIAIWLCAIVPGLGQILLILFGTLVALFFVFALVCGFVIWFYETLRDLFQASGNNHP